MKSTAVTLLILGALFLGYDYYLVPPGARVVFARPATPPQSATSPEHLPDSAPPKGREQMMSSRTQSLSPSFTSPQPIKPAWPSESKPGASAPVFQPPKFDSIEVITQNWTMVPRTAFPRTVKLLEDTKFTLAIGSTTIRAGSEVTALSFDNGLLLVAQNEKSPLRKMLPPDATDFKGRLTAVYEQWKTRRMKEARKEFEERKLRPKPDVASFIVADDPTGKPIRAADGTYPLLLNQMQNGSPSDITPAKIIRWGEAKMETVKGALAWTIPVTYKARTMFGEMDVETLAYVHNGRMLDWVFKGSGEPVP